MSPQGPQKPGASDIPKPSPGIEVQAASRNQGVPAAPPPERKPRRRKGQPKPEKPELEGARWKKGFRPTKAKLKDEVATIAPIPTAAPKAVEVKVERPQLSPIEAAGIHVIELESEKLSVDTRFGQAERRVQLDDERPVTKVIAGTATRVIEIEDEVATIAPIPTAAKRAVQITSKGHLFRTARNRQPDAEAATTGTEDGVPPAGGTGTGPSPPLPAAEAPSESQPLSAAAGDLPPVDAAAAGAAAQGGAAPKVAPQAVAPSRLPARLPTRSMKAQHVVEAALFSAGKALSTDEIAAETGLDKAAVQRAIKELQKAYEERDTVLEVGKAGTKWAMQVRTQAAEPAAKFAPMEIAPKLLKTLALIAYHQPMKQAELVDMIGTKVYDHVPELVERGLVKAREDGATKILVTTAAFPEYFGLDAANPEEIRAAMARLVGLPPPPPKVEHKKVTQNKLGEGTDAAPSAAPGQPAAGPEADGHAPAREMAAIEVQH